MKERMNRITDTIQHALVVALIGVLALFFLGEIILPREHTSTNEECQFSEDQGSRVLPHKRRHSNPGGISLCGGPSHQD